MKRRVVKAFGALGSALALGQLCLVSAGGAASASPGAKAAHAVQASSTAGTCGSRTTTASPDARSRCRETCRWWRRRRTRCTRWPAATSTAARLGGTRGGRLARRAARRQDRDRPGSRHRGGQPEDRGVPVGRTGRHVPHRHEGAVLVQRRPYPEADAHGTAASRRCRRVRDDAWPVRRGLGRRGDAATGSPASTSGSQLLRTTDAGHTWHLVRI